MNLESLIFVSGISGSGKSTALKTLEDNGYFCMDNFPTVLIPKFLEMISLGGVEFTKIAFVIDVREGSLLKNFPDTLEALTKEGFKSEVIFLECEDRAIINRYKDTKRTHPLSRTDIIQGIKEERILLKNIKDIATKIIDTTNMNVHTLRSEIINFINSINSSPKITCNIISFGFKYGIPLQADFVFDVRFLPNPYFVPELKNLNGLDENVRNFVMKSEVTTSLLNKIHDIFNTLLPLYLNEKRPTINISIGCTGGRHRSVTIAEELAKKMISNNRLYVNIYHRDINR
ncbi:MAG: RNase adapter RapZ [Deltaproteobacteria bacterium]|nr:RNase adapter RapZ [Deltaproteobacteria bacterium]